MAAQKRRHAANYREWGDVAQAHGPGFGIVALERSLAYNSAQTRYDTQPYSSKTLDVLEPVAC